MTDMEKTATRGTAAGRLTSGEIDRAWHLDRKKERKRLLIVSASVLVLFILCSMVKYNAYYFDEKFVPGEYVKSWIIGIKLTIAKLTGSYDAGAAADLIESVGGSVVYKGAIARLKTSLMSFVAGAGISIAGAIFQTAYKNPMATPDLIGASAGIGLGNVVLVMLYSATAASQLVLRYKFCYGFTIICVLAVLLLGKLAGEKNDNFSVIEMVMMGSIVSQALNVVTMYIMYNLEDEDLLVYQELTLGTYLETDNLNMLVMFAVMFISIVPVLVLRYRLNILGLDKIETTSMGVEPRALRIVAQICGVLMTTAAMIHCGQVSMISMVVPYIVRMCFGSDFRYVCVYSALIGGALLMVCRMLTSFVLIADDPLPVTFVVSTITMPIFFVMLARQGRKDI